MIQSDYIYVGIYCVHILHNTFTHMRPTKMCVACGFRLLLGNNFANVLNVLHLIIIDFLLGVFLYSSSRKFQEKGKVIKF